MDLNEKLRAYHKAIEEEYSVAAVATDEVDKEQFVQKTQIGLLKRTPTALATLDYLLQYAESETVRLKAVTYVLDNALGRFDSTEDKTHDPLEALVKKLTAGPAGGIE